MILSDKDIAAEFVSNRLLILPFNEDNLQPASYDVTLADEFIEHVSSPHELNYSSSNTVIKPLQFMLASTVEKVKIPNDMVARVEGKSSLARLGLIVHITAGFIDPGFEGNITLELFNVNNVTIPLKAGMKIAQLSFERLSSPCARPYGSKDLGSKYQSSIGTVGSKLNG